MRGRALIGSFAMFATALTYGGVAPAFAADPGVTANEIVLGGSHPYSGPASAYGNIGRGIAAYFKYVNDHGGVEGRKITYIDKDDGSSPAQAVQKVHELVEQDKVFAIFDTVGTEVNIAIRPYLNDRSVPQLFVASGATTFGTDYKRYPWTIGWQPDYAAEATVYAQDILRIHPTARVCVLYQNDGLGNDYNAGLKWGLRKHRDRIVTMVPYEVSDPDVRSQVSTLRAAGCDTFVIFATPKFAVRALIAAVQESWHPSTYLSSVSNATSYVDAARKAAGAAAVANITSAFYLKDPADNRRYAGDAGMRLHAEIMSKYLPGADKNDLTFLYGMGVAYTMVDVLKKAGRDLTRKRVLDAATNLNERDNPFVYPGIVVRTSPVARFPITQMILSKFVGNEWTPTGALIDVAPSDKPGGPGGPGTPPDSTPTPTPAPKP
jgi:branched-chain amino acid transport system substrate-binding protein